MKMKTVDDRLSELPDLLILEILSLLPMRDVVRTTILSKRWRDLWTTVPCLDFKLPPKEKKTDEREFINQVQKHWKGTSLRKFEISFIDQPLSGDIDSWLRFATEKKVQELCLNLPFDWSKPLETTPVPEYWLPQCVYSCSSITKLWINGCNLGIQESVIKWDKLKTLFLQGICFSEDVINQLVSSAPSLECLELRLRRSSHNLNIHSNSLKALTVVKYNEYTHEYDPSRYTMLTICAPKLESLGFVGNAYKLLIMDGAPLMTHASLCFYDKWYAVVEETLRQILPAITHVEEVTLSPCAFKMLLVMEAKKSVLPFWKVKTLRLCGGPVKFKEIVGLAKLFPLVEKLVINWQLDQWYPFLLENLAKNSTYVESGAWRPNYFMTQVKKVEFTGYCSRSNFTVIILIIFFLRQNATMLQETVLGGQVLEEYEAKFHKQFKHYFKWGLLGIGITVTAYTFIKWWPHTSTT